MSYIVNEILQKHVTICMENGAVLEGFALSTEDNFIVLIETNNKKVIIRVDDISFARLGGIAKIDEVLESEREVSEEPLEQYSPSPARGDYSMEAPAEANETVYRRPTFVRST